MSYQIVDIVAFFDVGIDLIMIYKLTDQYYDKIHYIVEIQKGFNSSLYYRIAENLNIRCLFDMLKYNNCCLKNVNEDFVLAGIKFYDINLDQTERNEPLRVAATFNYNPIGLEFQQNISDIPVKDYKEVFQNFELLGNGGFPIF
jgi:hypothetical protein